MKPWVGAGESSMSQSPLYSNNSNDVFPDGRELPRSLFSLCSPALRLLLSLWLGWVLLSAFSRSSGLGFPQRLCFELRGLSPLSLIIALAQPLDRKWEIYFIWLELHCSFLDYWCYFTLNNMTLCSQSAQGQSLRVIDTFKSRGGDYNQREGVYEERI